MDLGMSLQVPDRAVLLLPLLLYYSYTPRRSAGPAAAAPAARRSATPSRACGGGHIRPPSLVAWAWRGVSDLPILNKCEGAYSEPHLSEGLEHVEGASARGASPPHSGRHSGGRVSDCSDPSDCGLERRPDSALATPPPPSPPPPPSTPRGRDISRGERTGLVVARGPPSPAPSPPMPSIRTLSVGTASGGANTGSTRPPPCVPPGAGGLPQSPPPCRCSCGRGGLGGMPTPPLISAGRAPRVKAGLIWTNRPKLKILPCWSAAEAEAGRTKRQKACRGGLSGGMRPRRCCVTHGRRNLMPPGATSPNTRSAAATCSRKSDR